MTETPIASPLPRRSPHDAGVDPAGVRAFAEAMERAGANPHALMVVRGDAVVAEGWWHPVRATHPRLVYSVSKSFTATAAGFAIAEGRLALDDRVLDAFPGHRGAGEWGQVTLHHLLSMSTGHTVDTLDEALAPGVTDPVAAIFAHAPEKPVGSWHVYHNAASMLAALMVQQATGERLVDYLRPRLFDPLGVGPVTWQKLPLGEFDRGFTGLQITTETLAKLGLLYLRDGVWNGARVLPEGWAELASKKHIDTGVDDASGPLDWRQGYGYQFWRSRHGFRADGAFGQFSFVLPEQDAVVAVMAHSPHGELITDALWETLLPALGASGTASAAGELEAFLGGLSLAPVAGEREPGRSASGVVEDGDGWRVEVDGGGGGGVQSVRCGHGEWAADELRWPDGTSLPVATSGGWQAGTFVARLVVLTAPHTVELRCGDERHQAWVEPGPLGADDLAGLVLR